MMDKVINTCCLLLMYLLKGALCVDWSVHLPPGPICAVVGSAVVLPCSYDYPWSSSQPEGDGQQPGPQNALHSGTEQTYNVLSEMWCLEDGRCVTPRYVFHSKGIFPEPAYQDRVQYLGGELGSGNCSLLIRNLRSSDSGTYVFYVITNHTEEKMPKQHGVQLIVTDNPSDVAVAISPCGDIIEGVSLRLSCCSPTANPEDGYRWFRGSSPALGHDGQVWGVANVNTTDSDLYYCQLKKKDGLSNSTDVDVKVQYPPRSVSVSAAGSVVPAGSTVTLSCRGDGAPPVHSYAWYRGPACLRGPREDGDAAPLGTGQTYNATVTPDNRAFCCVAANKHGSSHQTLSLATGAAPDSKVKAHRLVTLGSTVAVVLVVMGMGACIITRRKLLRKSRSQSYSLTQTASTAP